MNNEEGIWMHKMANPPKIDFADIYIICMNRLYGCVKSAGLEKGETTCYKADGRVEIINWKRLLLVGPYEKYPFKRELKGFQGFRYCTKLF